MALCLLVVENKAKASRLRKDQMGAVNASADGS
jgi:hypothetical protein